jgi:hypothetical protein
MRIKLKHKVGMLANLKNSKRKFQCYKIFYKKIRISSSCQQNSTNAKEIWNKKKESFDKTLNDKQLLNL